MEVTVLPELFEQIRLPAGVRVRVEVNAAKDIDVGVLDDENFTAFCEANSEIEVKRLDWLEEVSTASLTLDVPDRVCWLVLWNAYEDVPLSIEYTIRPE